MSMLFFCSRYLLRRRRGSREGFDLPDRDSFLSNLFTRNPSAILAILVHEGRAHGVLLQR